jgi:hypothetical protein
MLIKAMTAFALIAALISSDADAKKLKLPEKLKLHNNAAAMKKELLSRIPMGSSIWDATRVLKNSGFGCSMLWNESFIDQDSKGNPIWRAGVDFLYCDKEKAVFPYINLQTRSWRIRVVHKNSLVSELAVWVVLIN